jgi:hypothetical protein
VKGRVISGVKVENLSLSLARGNGGKSAFKGAFYAYIRNLHISTLSPQWYRAGQGKLEWIGWLSLRGATPAPRGTGVSL